MTTYMLPYIGRGKELQDLLRRELGVPVSAISFSVHFVTGEVVRVQCEYMPPEPADRDKQYATFQG